MSRYDEIMTGLQEAIDYENGKTAGVTVHKRTVADVPEFTPEEIREIRMKSNMTQSVFAACIGVTKKAVEAWEGGRSRPDGAARRTLGLMNNNPGFALEVGIIS